MSADYSFSDTIATGWIYGLFGRPRSILVGLRPDGSAHSLEIDGERAVTFPPHTDADHAVALEREALAKWLESIVLREQERIQGLVEPATVVMFNGTPAEFIHAIRNGVHHDTPTALASDDV